MKIIKVLVDEMPSGCKRCNFCVAKMYCSLLEDRKTTVPDEPYKRRADCPLVYDFGDRETNALNKRIAELEAAVKGHDPFEEFPPKERGFECSVMVLGKFEYEEEFTTFTNWDLCVYWFDEERWHPLNGYVKGDDIVRWYALPPEVQE